MYGGAFWEWNTSPLVGEITMYRPNSLHGGDSPFPPVCRAKCSGSMKTGVQVGGP